MTANYRREWIKAADGSRNAVAVSERRTELLVALFVIRSLRDIKI